MFNGKVASQVSLLALLVSIVLTSACSGSDTSVPLIGAGAVSPPTGLFETKAYTQRFLHRASFGATMDQLEELTGTSASIWFETQLSIPATEYLKAIQAEYLTANTLPSRRRYELLIDAAIAGDDQLRQRLMFALSQMFVVSNEGPLRNRPERIAFFQDILSRNALGNYRDLLQEVTYSPAMSIYLTYLANEKGDLVSGRVPDENYARELLQLFTIGLHEINMDGTRKLDTNGNAIETFDNDDITGLARVFTGLSTDNGRFENRLGGEGALLRPLIMFDQFHSELEKKFLDSVIPERTAGDESIKLALDAVFAHSNVPPFVARQLIQRLTTSHPEPDYIQRVANAFASGVYTLPNGNVVGTARRGDLSATVAAILFDTNVLRDPGDMPPTFGKVREPILRLTNWARAFHSKPDSRNDGLLWLYGGVTSQLPFSSPSVFNFYRPGYIAPNSLTGSEGLTIPEFQITNSNTIFGYIDTISQYIYATRRSRSGEYEGGLRADYTSLYSLAHNPAQLFDHVDLLLTGGRLSSTVRKRYLDLANQTSIELDTEERDRLDRIRLCVSMVMTSPNYLIQK